MKAIVTVFLAVFVTGCVADDIPILPPKEPEPLNVRIAKECVPKEATCFVVPGGALQELERRFTTLKRKIDEQEGTIKELKEYQSKTCI